MSEKKSKEKRITFQIPKYDLEKQLLWLNGFCQSVDIPCDILHGMIMADFIMAVDVASKQPDGSYDFKDTFPAYLADHMRRVENYKKYLKDGENGKEK